MKKFILVITTVLLVTMVHAAIPFTVCNPTPYTNTKFDIKIKNDSGNEVRVINAKSGGTYYLQKNVITTIKMGDGDKLYTYEGGKKGVLLLTASAELDGKVQLYSKL